MGLIPAGFHHDFGIVIRFSAIFISLLVCEMALNPALANEARQGNVQDGKILAIQLCGRCHAVVPGEESPFSKAPPFQEIVGRWPLSYLEEAFAEGVTVGHEAMPEFHLTPNEIDNLLAYLASLPR